jgi:DNA-binding transcriptional regulator LsrR (DeoR family)
VLSEERLRLISQVAWLYHQKGLTQQQIAEHLNISRARVIKLLAEAVDEGIVRITVNSPYLGTFELEGRLCDAFGLQEAIIVASSNDPERLKHSLGSAGASYLERSLSQGDILGTAWGTTIYAVARQLQPRRLLPNLTVVQLIGGLSTIEGANSLDVAKVIADKYGASYLGLFAPAVVDSRSIRDTLLSDHNIRRVFGIAQRATKALIGIGTPNLSSSLANTGFASPAALQDVAAKRGVGELVGRFFDIHGQPVESELDHRTISLPLDDVREIPCVIAVAGGPSKVQAILGAIRGKYVDVLITDEDTAYSLLHLGAEIEPPPNLKEKQGS